MKSVRQRRFRKTKKKKYMEAPEVNLIAFVLLGKVERELKRLLRADLEAESFRWEIVQADDKRKVFGLPINAKTCISATSAQDTTVSEQALFGDKVSSSEEDVEDMPQVDKDD
ncbi:unnamed protein product [Haemonchus placei]|uniref:TAFII55_N domain-containing protein n=1 Tax=Haemonchus placei TaxID=6290 RepID=A0A0N4VUT3_HAEPC|nr:unnamed protein product [Haemonchus placei]